MSGIILASASKGATQADVEKVLAAHVGEENIIRPEVEVEAPVEPKRDDFDTEEDFEAAHVEWQDKQEKPEEKDEEEGEEEEEKPVVRKPSKFQRRIGKITSRLEQENKELRDRLAAIEKGEKKDDKKADENPRPKRADFDTDEKYEDALLAWGTEKALAEKSTKDAQRSQQEYATQIEKDYKERLAAFKETVEDADEVLNQDIPVDPAVQWAMKEEANGPEMAYYLGRHPEYAKKLYEMSPHSAVKEVGRLSDRLLKAASGSPAPGSGRREQPKPKPRVPAPVRPVNTSATASTLTSRDAAQKGDFRAFRAAQRAGR